jgi:hypothetical protein
MHKMGADNNSSLQVPAAPGEPSQVGAVPPKESPNANAAKLEKAPEWYNRMQHWANQNRDNLTVGGNAAAGGLLSYILARKLGARRGASLLAALFSATAVGGLEAYRLANNKVPKFTV